MSSPVLSAFMNSAFTFRQGTSEKFLFIALNYLDLMLTTTAISCGLSEMNPIVSGMLYSPLALFVFKILAPIGLAWAIPGKWLYPGILLMGLVFLWNIKELLVFFTGA